MTRRRLEAASERPEGLTRKRVCELLGVPRASSYRAPSEPSSRWSEADEARAREIDRIHLDFPAYGARKAAVLLGERGLPTTRWKANDLMVRMGVRPCCPLPSLSGPAAHRPGFPYLLANKDVLFPNQVWSTDVTYVQIGGGHMYLTAIIDWHSRYIVGWRLSDTMRALEVCACWRAAFREHGTPAIANSDQGSVFSSDEYVALIRASGARQSMDGRRRWADNALMERWFRTLKSEWLRNVEYSTPAELEATIAEFVEFYNNGRIHQSLGYETPASWYFSGIGAAA